LSVQLPPAIPPKLASVPAFPAVVMQLLSLLRNEESGIARVAACIATDPIIAGRILKRANAADQARSEVRDVLHAILALGLERTREVALTTATLAYMGPAVEMETLRPCWHHTIATALTASEIARLCGLLPAEPYTAGLLHDIGRLGLLTAYPVEYQDIMDRADGQHDGLRDLERAHFGVDHTEAGLWLARKWNLPDSIAEVTARHHEAPSGPLTPLTIVQIACRMADLLGFAVGRPGDPPQFDEITAPLSVRIRNQLWDRIPALQDMVLEQIAAFGRVPLPPKVMAQIELAVDEEELRAMEIPLDLPCQDTSWLQSIGPRAILPAIAVLIVALVLLIGR
jgi:putative nucleotidyltransferase with HDIG domain